MTEGYNVQLEHSSQESRSTLGDVTLKTVDGAVLSSFPGYQDNRNMRDLSRNADSLVSQAVAKLEAAPLPAPTGGSSNCSGKADCCPEKTAAEKVACCGVGVGVGVGVKYGSSKEEAAVKGDCCAEEAAASKAGCTSKKSGCSTHDRSKTGGAVAEATRGSCAGGECCFSSSQLVLIGLMLVVAAGACGGPLGRGTPRPPTHRWSAFAHARCCRQKSQHAKMPAFRPSQHSVQADG